KNGRGGGKCPVSLEVEPGVVMPLVESGVGVAHKIGEAKPPPIGSPPHLVGFMIRPAHKAVDGPRTLNRLDQLGAGAPQHQADRTLPIYISVPNPFAKHAVGFAATTRATKEHLKDGAFEQSQLRRITARRPGYCIIVSGSFGGEYFFTHASSLSCGGTSMT